MKLEIVAVYDRAIQTYGRPVFVPHVGAMVRQFMDELSNPETDFGKHPEDYDLFHVGEFDDHSARFVQFDVPKLLLAGRSAARPVKEVKRA